MISKDTAGKLAQARSSTVFAFAPAARHPDPGIKIVSSIVTRSEASARMVEAIARAEMDLTEELSEAEANEPIPRNDRLLVAAQLCQTVHLLTLDDPALVLTDVPRPVLLLINALSNTVHGSRPEVLHWSRNPTLPTQELVILSDLPAELSQNLSFSDSRSGAFNKLSVHLWRLKSGIALPRLELGILIEAAAAISDYVTCHCCPSSRDRGYPAVANLMSELVVSLRGLINRSKSPLLDDRWIENARGRPVVVYRDLGRAIVVSAYELLRDTGATPSKAADWVAAEMAACGLFARSRVGLGARALGPVPAAHIRNWSRRLASSNAPLGWMNEIRDRVVAGVWNLPPFVIAQDQTNQIANLEWAEQDMRHTARAMIRTAGSFWIE